MSLEKVVVEYKAEVAEFRKELASLKKDIGGVADSTKDSAKKSEESLNNLSTKIKGGVSQAFKTLGATIAAAFAIRAIGNFINSTLELATAAQEVKNVFAKLNDATLLAKLREAVQGTVSDVKLMQIAIKANNFKIPLNDLAKLFEFAKLKADETGQSVEALADTIVQSVGRNSTRALVELGISQQAISTKVKETGSLYQGMVAIIDEGLAAAGADIDSAADKQDRLKASIENTKVELGEKFLPLMASFLDGLNVTIDQIQHLFDKSHKTQGQLIKESMEASQFYIDNADAITEAQSVAEKYFFDSIKGYKGLNAQLEAARIIQSQYKDQVDDTIGSSNVLFKSVATGQKMAVQTMTDWINATQKNIDEQTLLLKYSKMTRDELSKLADQGDELAQRELQRRGENIKSISKETDEFEESIRIMTLATQAREAFTAALVKFGQVMGGAGIQIETVTNEIDGQGGSARQAAGAVGEMTEAFVDNRTELEKQLEAIDIWGSAFLSVIDSVNEYYSNSSQYRSELLQDELKRGIISQGQFDREIRDMKIKEAKREKAAGIFHIVISTAEAIMAALAQANPFLAVAAGITGATQLGVVASKPIPAFKKGGQIKGNEQIIRVNEEGEEFIAHARATRKHKSILEAINNDRLDQYIIKNYNKIIRDDGKKTDDGYREFLELKKLGYINVNGFKSLERALIEKRGGRF